MIDEDLENMGFAELRALWAKLAATGPLPALKRLAVREIAWLIQSRKKGDLNASTRRLLHTAMRRAKIASSGHRPRAKTRTRAVRTRALDLQTGTKLVRKWRGHQHEVHVLENGKQFEYRGETYPSLTQIAEKITSAHWSGPRFFGLYRVRGVS